MTPSSAPIIRAAQVTPIQRLSRWVAWAAVAYALAAGAGLAIVPLSSPTLVAAPAWVALPVQLTAMLLCSLAALRATDKPFVTRPTWITVLAFCALSAASTVVWNVWRPQGIGPVFSYADALYLVDYAMLTVAYLLLITRLGGSFRSATLWLDALTVLVAVLAAFWVVLLSPALRPSGNHSLPVLFSVPYGITLAMMMTMAAVLFIRMPDLRSYRAALFLIGAGLMEAAWEIAWVAGWLTDVDFVGPFYNFGDVGCFALIGCAAADVPYARWEWAPIPHASTAARMHLYRPSLRFSR